MKEVLGWRDDQKMLGAVAEFKNTKPEYLLEDLSKKTGEDVKIRDLEEGRQLPIGVRNELRILLNNFLKESETIHEECVKKSSNVIPFMIKMIIGSALVFFLFGGFFGL